MLLKQHEIDKNITE